MQVRENEHFDYKFDDDDIQDVPDERVQEQDYYDEYDESYEYGNEMARSAVERFLESESGDANDQRQKQKPSRREGTPESDKRSPSTPQYENDEEYMARLADAKRERQRRREQNPVPKPAVRVGVERPRRSSPTNPVIAADKQQVGEDWEPMPEDDFNNFRKRYNDPHVMAPREVKAGVRSRTATAAPRRDSDAGAEGPSPLRYMLFIILFGMLVLMAFLAVNNRNLRQVEARYRDLTENAPNYTAVTAGLQLDLDRYREANASLRAELDAQAAQLRELGYGGEDPTYNYSPPEGTTGRPEDDATATDDPPPADPPPPPPPPSVEYQIHVVESGQYLSHIANLFFTGNTQYHVNRIVELNGLASPDDIQAGQELRIPVN